MVFTIWKYKKEPVQLHGCYAEDRRSRVRIYALLVAKLKITYDLHLCRCHVLYVRIGDNCRAQPVASVPARLRTSLESNGKRYDLELLAMSYFVWKCIHFIPARITGPLLIILVQLVFKLWWQRVYDCRSTIPCWKSDVNIYKTRITLYIIVRSYVICLIRLFKLRISIAVVVSTLNW